jgi:anti-sigma B factor antagonist
MRVERTTQNFITVISLIGDLDESTVDFVLAELVELAETLPPDDPLLLDLGAVGTVSSAGLRALLLLYRRARRNRLRLAVAAVPPELAAILSGTGFADALTLTDTVPAGVRVLSR